MAVLRDRVCQAVARKIARPGNNKGRPARGLQQQPQWVQLERRLKQQGDIGDENRAWPASIDSLAEPTPGLRSALVDRYVEQRAAEFAADRPPPPPIPLLQLRGRLFQPERVGMHEQQARLIWFRGQKILDSCELIVRENHLSNSLDAAAVELAEGWLRGSFVTDRLQPNYPSRHGWRLREESIGHWIKIGNFDPFESTPLATQAATIRSKQHSTANSSDFLPCKWDGWAAGVWCRNDTAAKGYDIVAKVGEVVTR